MNMEAQARKVWEERKAAGAEHNDHEGFRRCLAEILRERAAKTKEEIEKLLAYEEITNRDVHDIFVHLRDVHVCYGQNFYTKDGVSVLCTPGTTQARVEYLELHAEGTRLYLRLQDKLTIWKQAY